MRVALTGASGFVGAHVAAALADAGATVRSVSRTAPPTWARAEEHVAADVRDPAAVARALAGCELVVHTAALYSYDARDAEAMREVNVTGTRHVLEAAGRGGTRRVLVTSSATTCGPVAGRVADERDAPPPRQLVVPYKRTKVAAEQLALRAAREGLDVVVVNPTAVLGAGDRRPTPTGRMVADVAAGRIRAFAPGAGLNVVAVGDVASGHVLACERGRAGRRYILGGENVALRELFALIARCAGRPPPRWPVPQGVALAAAWGAAAAGRVTGRAPRLLVLDEVRLARVPEYFTSARASRELGYAARPASVAVAEAVAALGAAPS